MSKSAASAAKPLIPQMVRLIVPAGKAAPTPPVGPALGQRGVKAIDFCKQFNDRTKHIIQGAFLCLFVQSTTPLIALSMIDTALH